MELPQIDSTSQVFTLLSPLGDDTLVEVAAKLHDELAALDPLSRELLGAHLLQLLAYPVYILESRGNAVDVVPHPTEGGGETKVLLVRKQDGL